MERVSHDEVESAEAVPGVHLSLLAGGERMNVQGFFIEPGGTVPTHSHPHEQVGYLTAGALTFVVGDETGEGGGETVRIEAGDSYVIPGDEPHRAVNDGDVPAEGFDVFSPPRDDPDWRD